MSAATAFVFNYVGVGVTMVCGLAWICAHCLFLSMWYRHTTDENHPSRNPWRIATTAYGVLCLMVFNRDLADRATDASSVPSVERARRRAVRLNRALVVCFGVTFAMIVGLMVSVVVTGGPP